MPSWVSRAGTQAYRLTTGTPGSDELVEVQPGLTVRRFVLEWSRSAPEEARAFLERLPAPIELAGASVLVIGRGAGDLGIEVAGRSPRRVLALDMAGSRMELARQRMDRPDNAGLPLEIAPLESNSPLPVNERFSVVLASDAFRHYGAEPGSRHLEKLVEGIASCLDDGGRLGVGFGPPWKGPFGGSGDSRLPWAHLLVPEQVIFREFRRARPGNSAASFDDVGINRITVGRFRAAMRESGLTCLREEINVGGSRGMTLLRALARFSAFEEYMAQNLYGVWRR